MKIGLLVGDITRSGGTEKALINLINLYGEEHEFVIFSPSSNMNTPIFYEIPKEVKLFHFNLGLIPDNHINKIKFYNKFYNKLKNEIVVNNFDVLIGYGHSMSIILSLFSKNNLKCYAYEHADYSTMPIVTKILVKKVYKRLNGLIVLSQLAHNNFSKLNNNVKIIPNHITIPVLDETIKKQDRIIMVGRLSNEKGYDRIVNIAKSIQVEFPNWTIDIFGDGPLKADLKNIFAKNQLNNVKLHGAVKNINKEFQTSKIFMMTSHTEAMPFVILEAKTFGLPIVAYENEGTKLLVNDQLDGFLVENDSEEIFIEKLNFLITNEEDSIKMGQYGKNSISEFSPEAIKLKWDEIFKNDL